MSDPTLSIITVHMNDFNGLEKTMESVAHHQKLQWVVVDGESLILNERHKAVFDSVKTLADVFVSEPDAGIYDAMNKGTKLAKGDYLLYLNAGDELHQDFDFSVISAELDGQYPAMIWGRYDESGKHNAMKGIEPRKPTWLWWGMPTSHQAILFNNDLIGSAPYDVDLRIAGDYDLVLKLYRQQESITQTQRSICIADANGISNTKLRQAFAEQMVVRTKYYGTSKFVNLYISFSKVLIGWIGQIEVLRRFWK